MDETEALETLKTMLEETDPNARMLPDDRLTMLLKDNNYDVRQAAYQGALLKSRCTGISLPDGVSLESNRDYWLTVSRVYRGNHTMLAEVNL